MIRKIRTIHTPETRRLVYRKSKTLLVNGKHSLKDIVDHSEKPINLIKPGDIIDYESIHDGIKVKREVIYVCTDVEDYKWGEGYVSTFEDDFIRIDEIKSIITREQYDFLSYKVGE